VKELDNQDPLEDINLDFSLPFPQANAANAAIPYKEAPRFTRDFVPLEHLVREETVADPVKPSVSASYQERQEEGDAVDMATENNSAPTRRTSGRSSKSRQSSFGRGAGGDHGSPKIPEPRMTAAQRKHAALQEKNRRAQRRFRERQKQRVAELEDQVAALEAQIMALTRENEALAHRYGQAERGGDGLNLEVDRLPNGESVPTRESKMIAINEVLAQETATDVVLSYKRGEPEVVLTTTEMCAMSHASFTNHFLGIVKQLASTVVDGGGTAEADKRVLQLVDQALRLWHRVSQCNPKLATSFATSKLDEGQRALPSDERSVAIMRALCLTNRQKSQLCTLRTLFLQRLASIAGTRSNFLQPCLTNTATLKEDCTSSRRLAMRQTAINQSAESLASSLMEECTTMIEFEMSVTRHVLTPHQVAQFLIQSYPWAPDCLSLTNCVASGQDGDGDSIFVSDVQLQVPVSVPVSMEMSMGMGMHPGNSNLTGGLGPFY
jgi:hypothetical protein